MIVTITGIQKLDFTSRDGGKIRGTSLFVTYDDERVIGQKTEKFFINESITLPQLEPGDEVAIYFNQRGKVEAVQPVED